jgi:hypothetical protein
MRIIAHLHEGIQIETDDSQSDNLVPNTELLHQEGLQQDIDNAKEIDLLVEGPSPTSTHLQYNAVYAPNNGSWNIILPYARDYVGWEWFLSFNVDDKVTNYQTTGYIPPYAATPDDPTFDMQYSVRLGEDRFIYADKVVWPLQTKYDDVNEVIFTYDTASNTFLSPFVIPEENFKMLVADMNEDGIIRASGYTRDWSHLWFYQYNPHTQDFAMSTQYPISIGGFSDYSYQMTRTTGDWLVMGVGANPWILAAYNFVTGEWKTLKEIPGLGSYKTFQLHKLGDGTIIVVSEEIAGDPSSVTYWLFDNGNFTSFVPTEPINNTIDYRHDIVENYPQVGGFGTVHYDRSIDINNLSVPLLLNEDTLLPDPDGTLNLQYTYEGTSHTLTSHVEPFKTDYIALGASNDYLFGAAAEYGEHVFYHRDTGEKFVFNGEGQSVYTLKAIGNKVYMSGYPNFVTREYDLDTMTVKEIGHFQDEVQTHRPLAGIEEGSDGKIYIGGEYYRTREGGGLAIYDPLTEEKDGVIIEGHKPHWMTSVDSGNYMILSSKSEDGLGVPEVYDVMEKRLTFHRPNDDIYPGYVVGVIGTHFIGYGRSDAHGPVIYRYDPIERQLYWI